MKQYLNYSLGLLKRLYNQGNSKDEHQAVNTLAIILAADLMYLLDFIFNNGELSNPVNLITAVILGIILIILSRRNKYYLNSIHNNDIKISLYIKIFVWVQFVFTISCLVWYAIRAFI